MKETICGHAPFFSKGLCQKCYFAQPAVKAKRKEYRAQHASELKAKRKEYYAKKRARLISQGKIQPRDSIQPFVNTFFKEFSKNKKWRQEGIQKMANLYATTTCDLTKTQQCTLEEKILLKAKKEDE